MESGDFSVFPGTILLPLLLLPSSAEAWEAQALQERAAQEYRLGLAQSGDGLVAQGHFQRAADDYLRLWVIAQSPETAQMMAQARLLAGDLGQAIDHYRQGLATFPHDQELQRGLRAARDKIIFPGPGNMRQEVPFPDRSNFFSRLPRAWTLLPCVGIYAVGLLLLARAFWIKRRRTQVFAIGVIGLASVLFAADYWNRERANELVRQPMVVVQRSTMLRMGNSEEYPAVLEGKIPPGAELMMLAERGGWLQVRIGSGAQGWVAKKDVVYFWNLSE